MKVTKRLLCLLLLFAFTYRGYILAQSSNFVNYGVQDGLVQSQVQALTQDDNGNLWIGTIGGLSKYNGQGFINYNQKDGLSEDWITSMTKDANGDIIFGHWGGGLSKYYSKTNSFRDLLFEKFSKYKFISTLLAGADGSIWVGTESVGVIHYDTETGEALEVLDENLISNNITALAFDHAGNLWIGTDKGITVYDTKERKKLKNIEATDGIGSNRITYICAAFEDEMWIGTADMGIARLKVSDKGANIKAAKSLRAEDGLRSNNVQTLFQDNEKNIWIGCKEQGVLQFIPQGKENSNQFIQGELNIFSNKYELKYYHANTIFQDREGNMWIGTEIGLNKYMGELFRLYNHNEGLINNLVWTVMADKQGNMWFGTTEGVSKFTFPKVNDKVQYHSPVVTNYTAKNGLSENIVLCMYEDRNGYVWMGTEHFGVNKVDPVSGKIKTYTTKNGLLQNTVYSICEDSEGNIWLGTKEGASMLNPATETFTNYTDKNGLGGKKVYYIFKDSKENVWLGLLGGDLTKYLGNGNFKTYGRNDGIEAKFIISIIEDNTGNIWFGSYGDGIFKYDGKTFTNYTTEHGMSRNSPNFMMCDPDNNIWLGMNVGIEKLNQETGNFSLFGRKEGFLGIETNQNSVSKDMAGNIWFGTIRGGVKFDPKKDKKNQVEPVTFFTDFSIFLKKTEFPEEGVFPYDQNYLTFNVMAVSLTNPEQVFYKYKLDGFEEEWRLPTKQNNITYSGLPHGEYTLLIKACNNSGVYNKEPIARSFEITPPFWQTTWFYATCTIIILLGIWLFVRIRERKLKERQVYLESEVEARTEELRKEKEVVEKQNRNITESISYAKRIQETILPPMPSIKELLPDSFVLYKPKDIVSGDFYWVNKSSNKVLFAAVDCTGHGVPGAFMSIIGNNLLEQVVIQQKENKPANILNRLSEEVAITLRQGEGEAEVKDGMDLALCALDVATKKVEFAGAYNPLYLIRDKEVKEFKSDKIPIGKSNVRKSGKFTNHEIDLLPGDVLYIFSDGFADQKGGPKNKKFYYPPFRDLLLEIHELPMDEQRTKLEQTIEDWKGQNEQYDDMLVFGVKI